MLYFMYVACLVPFCNRISHKCPVLFMSYKEKFEARSSIILNNCFTLQENTLGLIERYKINLYVSKLCNDM